MSAYEHPDWPAFVRAVIESPDDDTPRLVAADWLEEIGDGVRAEFIRVQCALDRPGLDEAQGARLIRRLQELPGYLSIERALWASEACPQIVRIKFRDDRRSSLEAAVFDGLDRVAFYRGFVERVECPAEVWQAHGTAITERTPVRQLALVRCEDVWPTAKWLTLLPTFARLQRLVLVGEIDYVGGLEFVVGNRLAGVSVQALERVPFRFT